MLKVLSKALSQVFCQFLKGLCCGFWRVSQALSQISCLFSKVLTGVLSPISYTLFKETEASTNTIRGLKCNTGDMLRPFLKSRLGTKRHLVRDMIFSVAFPLNKKGFGLLEILVASVIGSALLVGGAHFLQITLQAHNISQSLLIESNLRQKIATALSNDCALESTDTNKLLKPSSSGLDSDLKGEFNGTLPGDIKKGDFKNQIEIVKIELKDPTSDPPDDARVFEVSYKKKNLGTNLNAPDSANCTATAPVKDSGCYKYTCQVKIATTGTTKHCTEFVECGDAGTVVLKERKCGIDELIKGIKANGELICESICPNTGRKKVKTGETDDNGKDIYRCECEDEITPANPFLGQWEDQTIEKGWIKSLYTCGTCAGTWIRRTSEMGDRTVADGTPNGKIIKVGEEDCQCPTGQYSVIHRGQQGFICCGDDETFINGSCCPNESIVTFSGTKNCCPTGYVQATYTPSWYKSPNNNDVKKYNRCCPRDKQKYHPGTYPRRQNNSVTRESGRKSMVSRGTYAQGSYGQCGSSYFFHTDSCCSSLYKDSKYNWLDNAHTGYGFGCPGNNPTGHCRNHSCSTYAQAGVQEEMLGRIYLKCTNRVSPRDP